MAYTPPSYPHLPDVAWGIDTSSRTDINSTASDPSDVQAQVAAENAPIRVIYGDDRIGAQIADVLVYQGKLILIAVWGEGPIQAIQDIWIDDAVKPATVTVWNYLGTAGQTVNSTLVAAYAAIGITFTDTFPNVAYSVLSIPADDSSGFPQVAALIRGRLVYDPRSLLTVWSDNPSLCLADFIQSTVYGLGVTVDYSTVITAANANDELVGGVKRRLLGLCIDSVTSTRQWIETLRTYAGCWVIQGDTGLKLIPDRPASVVASFTTSNILEDQFSMVKLGVKDIPTVIEIGYTDTSTIPWAEKFAIAKMPGVDAGTTPRRESRISLPGIKRYSQANREAIERLNHFNLEDLEASWVSFDEALNIDLGDVIYVTHPLGLALKQMRVTNWGSVAPGRWRINGREYDPAAYSDVVQAEPTYEDTPLPSPTTPPDITGLSVVEEVYQLDNGIWSSRIKMIWDAADYAYLNQYIVEVSTGGNVIVAAPAREAEYRTGPLQEGLLYQCRVAVVSGIGTVGSWAQVDVLAAGKTLIPSDVPAVSGFEAGGTVYLSWTPAIDIDIWRYEVRYGMTTDTWDDASIIDRVDALRLMSEEIPVGTWKFFVKALDSVQQYSVNAATVTLTVTNAANSFLVDSFNSDTPQWKNLLLYSEQFDNAAWANIYITIDDLATTPPPGCVRADKILETAVTNVHLQDRLSITTVTNAKHIFQRRVKAGERYKFRLMMYDSNTANYVWAIFDLVAETATAQTPGGTGSATSAHLRKLGDGWFIATLIGIPASTDSGSLYCARLQLLSNAGLDSYLGAVTDGLYVSGAQLSQAAYPHEYAVTTSAAIAVGGEGMFKYTLAPSDTNVYYVTEDDVAFATKFSSNLNTYTNPLAQYHADITSTWLGESEDFGQLLGGQWTGVADVAAINGSLTSYLGISADGSSWTYNAGLSQKDNGRFARLKHESGTTSTIKVTVPDQNIRIDAIPREEVGAGSALATGANTVTLANEYVAVKKLTITPEGTAARIAVYDNIVVGNPTTFDVYIFDAAGARVACDYLFTFQGV